MKNKNSRCYTPAARIAPVGLCIGFCFNSCLSFYFTRYPKTIGTIMAAITMIQITAAILCCVFLLKKFILTSILPNGDITLYLGRMITPCLLFSYALLYS